MDSPFPEGFWWGAATSAHQVEGDNRHNDWWAFEEAGRTKSGERSGAGVDHFHRFADDFEQARQMGHNAHRLSIEWSRLEPRRGAFDEAAWHHYDQVLSALKARQLEPFLTLWHFTTPQWVMEAGGWLNPETPAHFLRFVEKVVNRYHDAVTYYITLNEPTVYAFYGYDQGTWPPGRRNRNEAVQVILNLMGAHAQASAFIHHVNPHARVGMANHLCVFDPLSPWNPLDWLKAALVDRFFNWPPLDAQVTGSAWLALPGQRPRRIHNAQLVRSVDFIGLNYYTRWRQSIWSSSEQLTTPGAVTNDLGWELYPEGLYRILKRLSRYPLPVIITENGMADAGDRLRPRFLAESVRHMKRAIDEGCDVRGYFHWSLLDNFEWAEGYGPRFGLLRVDRETPGMPRSWTESAHVYQRIIETGRLPPR